MYRIDVIQSFSYEHIFLSIQMKLEYTAYKKNRFNFTVQICENSQNTACQALFKKNILINLWFCYLFNKSTLDWL